MLPGSQNLRVLKFLDILTYVFILLTVVTVPLFIDRNLANFYIIPKEYAFICLVLLSLVVFVARTVLSKKIIYRRSVMDWPLVLLLLFGLFSAIFSANIYDSFLGRGEYFALNFVSLVFLTVFYLLFVNTTTTKARWYGLLDTLVGVGGATALVFILKAIFKLDLLFYLAPALQNTIDRTNTAFGVWLVIIFILAAGRLLKKNLTVGKSLFYFFVTLISFASLVLLSFTLLWWVLLAGLVLLLLIGVSFVKEVRLGWVSALFAAIIIVSCFIAFGTPKYLQTSVPAEVSLGFKPSWTISSNTLFSGFKNFLLGSGLGTFNVDFSQFRSVDFNNDAWAWSLRFSQPLSTFLALLAEGGLPLVLIFIFIVVFGIGHLFHILFKKNFAVLAQKVDFADGASDWRLEIFLVAAAWLVLSGATAAVFFGPALWWLWWFLFAMVVVGLSFVNPEIVKAEEWAVEDTPQYNLAFSFVMIVVTAALILIGVWGARLYLAEFAYVKALQSTDYAAAEANMQQALARRQSSDLYHSALAQIYLLRAADAVNKQDATAVSSYLAQAVNEARLATELSPRSVAIWENLAVMYENTAMVVPEAREWAIKSWQKAKELEPTNPVISLRLGNNYTLASQLSDAIKSYNEAISLKRDFLDAYVGLAGAYEQDKKINEAADTYRQALLYGGGNNAMVLFDYGRLLYNRNEKTDRKDAEQLWLAAVRVQPNYSNALYSLGLLYESRGDKTAALQYYYKVKDLNPDNKEIITKIRNLLGAPAPSAEE